jgi:DNA-binding MurR/RpiR family transcriptional regulator
VAAVADRIKAPLLEELARVYSRLTGPQQRVAEYILKHPDKARDASVSAMCRATRTSEPVLFAVCRATGRKGYRELKLDLAGELAVLRDRRRAAGRGIEESGPDVELNGDETPSVLARKIGAVYLESVEQAIEGLDADRIERVAKLLGRAGKVAVFGRGTSGHVAEIAHYALTRAGVTATFSADGYVQLMHLAALNKGDVALGISYRGEQPELVESLCLARKRGATAIAITSMPRSPMGKAADLVLELPPRRPLASYVSVGARIAAAELFVVDVLAASLALADKKGFEGRAEAVREIVEGRKTPRRSGK